MAISEALQLAPLMITLGFLLEPPFDRYILPVLKMLGKES